MNILKRISNAWRRAFNKSSQTVELNNLYSFLGIDPDTSEQVLSEATYFACMKVLSEAVGKLPLKLLRHTDRGGVETARDHELYQVLNSRPNPYMTATTFWSTVEFNRNHYGNAYVLITGAGDATQLWILPSTDVEVWYDDAKLLSDQPDIYYLYSCAAGTFRFGSEEVMHFKTSNSLDGIVGVSVQDQLKGTIGGGVKSQKMLSKLYDSGFTAKAVLNYTGSLSDANVKELLKMTEAYGQSELADEGISNIIPVPVGFSLQPLNVKLADSQFIEVKQYTALQIASAFGIKPYQIGDYTKSSYASAEAQQLSFYVDTLLYILKQYEEEICYKVLSASDVAKGYYPKFNVAAILRADLATQIKTLAQGVSSFIYTPNEARAMLDLEAKEGGDKLLGNGASIPVELAGTQYIDPDVVLDTSDGDGAEDAPQDPEG